MSTTSNPFDMFETDNSLETQGIIVDYGQFWIKIGRIDVPGTPFATFMTEKMRPYTRAIQLGEMDNKIAEEILREGFAKYLTFAWGSKEHGDGVMVGRPNLKTKKPVAIEFTPENIIDVYKTLPKLFQDLLEQSRDFTNFRKAKVETDAGN